jgi:hypothetical protein
LPRPKPKPLPNPTHAQALAGCDRTTPGLACEAELVLCGVHRPYAMHPDLDVSFYRCAACDRMVIVETVSRKLIATYPLSDVKDFIKFD